ncbi:hypothetical protein RhiJN_02784 [Ceratobasidium sp. AG-Ba]|nr:hypothetical protein RhiJN_02784 [Ceratobasidium sp. AG-Ba]QRW03675.1 hypothetical protein RhiLY_02674 [Ceratobasidium sp. AG-Ba]
MADVSSLLIRNTKVKARGIPSKATGGHNDIQDVSQTVAKRRKKTRKTGGKPDEESGSGEGGEETGGSEGTEETDGTEGSGGSTENTQDTEVEDQEQSPSEQNTSPETKSSQEDSTQPKSST